MNFKDIHIGKMIEKRVQETQVDIVRICNFLKCSEKDVVEMYKSESIDSQMLLRWSKLLQYDFFRIYSQHILLFSSAGKDNAKATETSLPQFRKNIYTKEIIEFILEQINSGKKTKQEAISIYNIPKTTLYKWFSKYDTDNKEFTF